MTPKCGSLLPNAGDLVSLGTLSHYLVSPLSGTFPPLKGRFANGARPSCFPSHPSRPKGQHFPLVLDSKLTN